LDLEHFLKLGLGYLGLTLEQFWDYTPRILQLHIEGKMETEKQIQQSEWERMRFQTVCLINKDRKTSNQIKLKDLITFDWEKKTKVKDLKKEHKKVQYLMHKANVENKNKMIGDNRGKATN